MRSARPTTNSIKAFLLTAICTAASVFSLKAQENSPYSRYGMGDLAPNQNIISRGMGGLAAGYSDYGIVGAPFSINLTNPAALGSVTHTKNFSNTLFDIGTEVTVRTLKSTTTTDKFKSVNAMVSYLQIAFPVSTPKMEKKGKSWGLSLGLKPLTHINYKIEKNSRLSNIDSLNTLYEGNGGLNQVNVSTGFKKIGKGIHKNEISFGLSSGYTFGTRDYSTRLSFINDSVIYYKSNAEVQSRMGGVFLDAGFQYLMHIKNRGELIIGAYANMQHKLNAYQTTNNETFGYDASGGIYVIDSVSKMTDVKGEVVIPMTIGAGFTYHSNNKHWLLGADFEQTKWNRYKYYGNSEMVTDNWTLRAGAEFYPAKANSVNNSYWSYLKYRAGFYYGPDYLKINETRNNFAFTAGATLPLTTPRYVQSRGEYVSLNTSFEIGSRGSKTSYSLRENFTRFNVGISMNARWFQKRSYD